MGLDGARLAGLRTDIKLAILFSTRLPLFHAAPIKGADVARASWALPIAGALVGSLAALVWWLAHALGLPPLVAAALTLTATLAATGCLHEDGLADTADGFGGGENRERKLEIMRDSRIGSYGACALILSLMLRAGALASLADPLGAALALVAAHAGARATMPIVMLLVPQARTDGLSADAGRPPRGSVLAGGVLGLLALGLCLGLAKAMVASLFLCAAVALMAWLAMREIGGQTGDVLGALEQTCEILILMAAVA